MVLTTGLPKKACQRKLVERRPINFAQLLQLSRAITTSTQPAFSLALAVIVRQRTDEDHYKDKELNANRGNPRRTVFLQL
jgi:hypothetical protein